MVEEQIRVRRIRHEGVVRAMSEVPRHEFVPEEHRPKAYDDRPLPIGHGQTISQPYMVAAMTEALRPRAEDRVLEVGTGSGYQAAVLARLVASVCTIEWIPVLADRARAWMLATICTAASVAGGLADRARATLERLGITNVRVLAGDGSLGVRGDRFDGIIVTAGAPEVPPALVEQLTEGGRIVMPCGTRQRQVLTVVHRQKHKFEEEQRDGCVFVPLQGESGW